MDDELGELRGQVAALSQHLKAVDTKAGSKKARKKNRIESGLGIQSGESPSTDGSNPADNSRRECVHDVPEALLNSSIDATSAENDVGMDVDISCAESRNEHEDSAPWETVSSKSTSKGKSK